MMGFSERCDTKEYEDPKAGEETYLRDLTRKLRQTKPSAKG
jgi:hypothetical protein